MEEKALLLATVSQLTAELTIATSEEDQLIHQLETNQAEAASLADQLASAQERLATAEATETQLIAGQAEQEARNARLVAELAEDAEMKKQLQDTARELRRKELDHSMVMEDLAVSKDR